MRPLLPCTLLAALGLGTVAAAQAVAPGAPVASESGALEGPFRRIASFPVFENTDVGLETAAEIVATADRGRLLVYTDSFTGSLGFIDILDPHHPQPGGVVSLPGSPTSVIVRRNLALVCVDTSASFTAPSGTLEVIDIPTRQTVRSIPLGGQPDSIALSPDGRYAAIAIENQRDEDFGDGAPPQAPAGFLTIVDLVGGPQNWTTRDVDLTGLADLYPQDPEPEYVDINAANIAVVTLQENNHLVFVALASGQVLADFSAGSVDLDGIDTEENGLIEQDSSLAAVLREPDAVQWISPLGVATANEGDLDGGSRGFTTWSVFGEVLFDCGNEIEQAVARLGHYPEDRSENKGAEPEGAEYAVFGGERFLFVAAERANVLCVYELGSTPVLGDGDLSLRQVLPTGVAPEGLVAIPGRNLLAVACEVDARGDKIRATVQLYEYTGQGSYPTVVSDDLASGAPIPWAAQSGLATDPADDDTVYSIHDSYYRESRIYTLDRSGSPARIVDQTVLRDEDGLLAAALQQLALELPGVSSFDPAELVNGDGTVNLDLEGVATVPGGGFWVTSEGGGNLVGGNNGSSNPFLSPNLLLQVAADGRLTSVVQLPLSLTENQLRFGFEGVSVVGNEVYVAFQRAWTAAGDPANRVRIGRYHLLAGNWSFAHYPLDPVASPNGGWVGLSDLVHLGGERFAVLERDDQGGPDAAVKRLYTIDLGGVEFLAEDQVGSFPVLAKELALDLLLADVYGPTGGPVPEKLEGLTVLSDGTALLINDNDGVEDNSGETHLIELPALFR
jgi:hypothetical protein